MDWRVAYLRAAGIKPTQPALDFLAKWQPFEGGHTNNDARFNYLNTTQRMPGSRPINSVGVQSYGSLAQGAQAFAKTIHGDARYSGLVSLLRTGQGDPGAALQTWVSGSPTGNPGYAAKVTGAPGGTGGSSVSNTPDAVPTPDFTPLTQPGVDQDAVRQYAVSGLGDIARGKRASEVFADTSKFMSSRSMRSLASAIPKVDIPTVDQGGTDLDQQATSLVQKYLGVKYTWGGTTAAGGFDCSGLVQTVWKQLGVEVPRTSQEQWKFGKAIGGDLRPGDAVFFVGSDGTPEAPGHEGMYVGSGKFIEAPHTGAVVRVSDLAGRTDYVGARRFA